MNIEFELKYCSVGFTEDDDNGKVYNYAIVSFKWGDKSDKWDTLFSMLMDVAIRDKIREVLAPLLDIDPIKDIYLEDTWLMINDFKPENKKHLAGLIAIVKGFEEEFDDRVSIDESKQKSLFAG